MATNKITNLEEETEILPKLVGIYTKGKAEDKDVVITVDTGASCTIMKKEVFDCLKQVKLIESETIESTGDENIKTYGRCNCTLQMSEFSIRKPFVVADITDDILLGFDFILPHKVILNLQEDVMKIGDFEVPLIVSRPKIVNESCSEDVRRNENEGKCAVIEEFTEAEVKSNDTMMNDANQNGERMMTVSGDGCRPFLDDGRLRPKRKEVFGQIHISRTLSRGS